MSMKPPVPPEPELHQAIRLGDLTTADRLLKSGVDVDARCDLEVDNGPHLRKLTPLMVAARSIDGASVETLRWLCNRGADLHARSEGGNTAAWYAAGKGGRWEFHEWRLCDDHADRLRFLLDAGLDPHECNSVGRSLMIEACDAADPLAVELLLSRGVSALPEFGAKQARDASMQTFEDVKARLREMHGQAPSQQLLDQLSSSIMGTGDTESLNEYQIPIFKSAASGSADCVRLLLDAGAPVDSRTSHRHTPLMRAGSAEVARLLIEGGADVHAESDQYDVLTELLNGNCMGACRASPAEIADVVVAAGADIEQRDKYGYTRLYQMAFQVNAPAVEFLLQRGANPNAEQRDGVTPLFAIAWQGEKDDEQYSVDCRRIVELLVTAGVDPNQRENSGCTAMHEAAFGDWASPTAIEALLRAGADPDPVNLNGVTPLMLAASNGDLNAVRLLLNAGADRQRRDNTGKTAVDFARDHLETWKQIVANPGDHTNLPDFPELREKSHLDALTKAQQSFELLNS